MCICKTFSCLQKIAFVREKFSLTLDIPFPSAVLKAPSLQSYCVLYSTYNSQFTPTRFFFSLSFIGTQENSSELTHTLAVRWPAGYGRPEFKSRLGTPGMFSEEQTSNEERGLGEWRWMNVLYECGYECMKKTAATQAFINSCTQSFLYFCSLLEKRVSESKYAFCVFFSLLFPHFRKCVCGDG